MRESFQLAKRLCRGCGAFLPEGHDCPACALAAVPSSGQSFALPFRLSVLRCDRCKREMSLGVAACPGCGEPVDVLDPRDGPTNRAKLAALGDLLPKFREVALVPSGHADPSFAVTDEQMVAYLRRTKALSDRLVGDLLEETRRVDLSTDETIRSASTRDAFEQILSHASEIRAVHDDLACARTPEQFGPARDTLIAVFHAALALHLAAAEATLALTIEDLQTAQRALQAALNEIAAFAAAADDKLRAIYSATSLETSVDRRLGLFVGRDGTYGHEDRPDLAAVLMDGLGPGRDVAGLGRAGAAHFDGLVALDPAVLPHGHGVALYVFAAELAASDDPLTVRRWTKGLLGLLNEAFRLDPAATTQAVAASKSHTHEAMVNLLHEGDALRVLLRGGLPPEALRQQLAQSYGTLVEWTYRRLLNLLLAAKFVLRGKPMPFERIAAAAFATKYDWLTKTSDPRFAPAVTSVSRVIRNANAHGDVETQGQRIRFVHRDKRDRTVVLGVEELMDEEFGERIRDLLLMCHALRLSGELFRIEHDRELPEAGPPTGARLLADAAAVVVGYFGLSRANVRVDAGGRVLVAAEEDGRTEGREPRGYLPASFTLAALFPESAVVELRVSREGRAKCRIETSTASVRAYADCPKPAKPYAFLGLCYASKIEPAPADGADRYRQEVVRAGARLLMRDVAALQGLRARLPAIGGEYRTALEHLLPRVETMTDTLREVEPPAGDGELRDDLLAGLADLRHGLGEHRRLADAGRWDAVARRSEPLLRGAERIVRLAR